MLPHRRHCAEIKHGPAAFAQGYSVDGSSNRGRIAVTRLPTADSMEVLKWIANPIQER